MTLFDVILILVGVMATLNWWPSRFWLFEVSGYFSQQFFFMLIFFAILRLLVPAPLSLFSWLLVGTAAVLALVHLVKIMPYTSWSAKDVPDADQVSKGERITFIVANIYQHNREYHRFVKLVQDHPADILVCLETDAGWTDFLSGQLDSSRYPYRIIKPQDDTYGLAIYSHYPIKEAKVKEITEVPSVEAVIEDPSGECISLFVVHPKPPVPGEASTSWPKDRELLGVAQQVQEASCNKIIVTGDLNEVAWSRTSTRFLEKSGLRDPRRGRSILNTFPAYLPWMGFPLDHFYCSGHFKIIEYRRLPDIGSDHFPLFISFLYPAAGSSNLTE